MIVTALCACEITAQIRRPIKPVAPPDGYHATGGPVAKDVGGSGILSPTPFGFRFGMTTEQIISLVGKDAVKDVRGDTLLLTTAPMPYAVFDSYRLVISPKEGLLSVMGSRDSIDSNRAGEEIRDAFVAIRDAIAVKYGPPDNGGDAPLDKTRLLLAFWMSNSRLPVGMKGIGLTAKKVYAERSGSLSLGYESDQFESYLASKKKSAPTPGQRGPRVKTPTSNWSAVKSWSGSGTIETESFPMSGPEWRVSWNCRSESRFSRGILQIYVKDATGKLISVAANSQGSGANTSYVHAPPGRFYLVVNSGNVDWAVSVEAQRQ